MKQFLLKVKQPAEKILIPLLAVLTVAYLVTGQMYLLIVHGRFLYLYIAQFLFLGIVAYMILEQKLLAVRSVPAALVVVSMFLSLSSALRSLELPFVRTAAAEWFQFLVLYFIAAYAEDRMRLSDRFTKMAVVTLKAVTLFQCLFIFAEYAALHFGGINLRNLIFFDTLKIDVGDLVYPLKSAVTGFCYSPPLLAPMFIIGMVMFDQPLIRLLFVVAAFLCRSSTSVAGVGLCLFLLIFVAVLDGKFKPSAIRERWKEAALWKKITYPVFFVLLVLFILFGGVYEDILREITFLWNRILSGSSEVHINYYGDIPTVFCEMNLYQKCFGYGNSCSGYVMNLLGYPNFPGTMIVESDVIDMIYSRGIFGLFTALLLQLSVIFRGFKRNKRYAVAPICFIVIAFGYNVQWHYMLFFTLLSLGSIAAGKDLFSKENAVFSKSRR